MTKAEMMKKAHELAKGFEGDYSACLSLALKIVWKEIKEAPAKTKVVYVKEWIALKNGLTDRACIKMLGRIIINDEKYDSNRHEVKRETEKAYLLDTYKYGYSKDIWVPKSQCAVVA